MAKFRLYRDPEKFASINRTIRFRPEVFEKIEDLSEEKGISFNRIVAQCVDFALLYLDDEENPPIRRKGQKRG